MKQNQFDALLEQFKSANETIAGVAEMFNTTWLDKLTEPTAIIALIVAVFSGVQLFIAKKHRRQEMFEKRWDLYMRVFDLFYRKQTLKEQITPQMLLPYANEANFLFSKAVAKHVMLIAEYQGNDLDYDWLNKPFKKYMRIK